MPYTAHDLRKVWVYLTDDEIDLLQHLVHFLPSNPVVINIGAGAGVSGLAIFQARDDVTLYTVDINWKSPNGSLSGELDAFHDAGIRSNHPRHKQIKGKSHDIAAAWSFGKADLIFVDDGHSWEDIEGDITGWLPHLKNRGVMVFHDYGSNDWPDVKRAVDEHMLGNELVALIDTLIAFKVVKE
jgi:predicted O-methyltransferase YrrM